MSGSTSPGPSGSSTTGRYPTQHQRSRAGCLTCRRRKVKCDEVRPICGKCTIRSRQCVWADGPSMDFGNSIARPAKHGLDALAESSSKAAALPANEPSTTQTTIDLNHVIAPALPDFSSLWADPFDTSAIDSLLQDVASWNIPPQPQRYYVPPDFLPKSAPVGGDASSGRWLSLLLPANRRATMMADPAFLQPYFPTIDERLVIRHYLLYTVHLCMAFENPKQPWNPWIEHHASLAFTHPPGVSPACDALRASMLTCGAVHLRHYHAPDDRAAAARIVRASKAKVLTLLRQVIDAQTPMNLLESKDIEYIMAALLSCTVASGLAADESWQELLNSIVEFVEHLGGPAALLQHCPRDKMSPLRFCCEQLAVRDVFGCFASERSPRILNIAFTPWFFDAESWSQGDDEWESVERMFGISRGMTDILARSCTVIAKISESGHKLSEHTNPEDFSLRLPARAVARLSTSHGKESAERSTDISDGDLEKLHEEINGLMAELKVWDQASNFTPLHPRTQYANHAYRHTIRIRLWTEVFGVSRRDPRVQKSARAIVELATELLVRYNRVTWLTWPVVIAGINLNPEDNLRPVVLDLLSEFRRFACHSVPVASSLLEEFWKNEETISQNTPAQAINRLRSRPFF